MTLSEILTILNIINGIANAVKATPDVVDHLNSLLDLIKPHIQNMDLYVKTKFSEAVTKVSSL